nr:hypothetical protein [Tanacetum cinerariifolium]
MPFHGCLAHHAKEALVSRTIKSLREVRVNLPLFKKIRKADNCANHMKNLVVNKPRTLEGGDVKLNVRCSVVLQNQLPPKEKDPGSFILPCSIGNLTVRNALADLRASISIMPLSMDKRLGLGILKPINMNVEMADRTKSIPKGIVGNLLVKIDKFIFPVDFVILDMVEDFRKPIILGRPLLATTHAKIDVFIKLISLEVGNEKEIDYRWDTTLDQGEPLDIKVVDEPNSNKRHKIDPLLLVKSKVHRCKEFFQQKGEAHEFWASCDPYNDQCDGGDVFSNEDNKSHWICMNHDKRIDVAWEGKSFKVNEEIEANYGVTREIEMEILKCSEFEREMAGRESALMKNVYDLQFQIRGLVAMDAESRTSSKRLEKEVSGIKMKRDEIIERMNNKREKFSKLCLDFQKEIDEEGKGKLGTLLAEKEYLENEAHLLRTKISSLQISMSDFVEEIVE